MATLPQFDDDATQKNRQLEVRARWSQWDYLKDALPGIPRMKGPVPSSASFDARYEEASVARTLKTTANHVDALVRAWPFDGIEDYVKLYPQLPRPSSAAGWFDDRRFAEQRLSGCNPMVIRRVDDDRPMPPDAAFTDEHVRVALGRSHSLAQAKAELRLFVCDYSILLGIDAGTQPAPKYLPAPIGLYYWRTLTGHENWGELVPVAIQLRNLDGTSEVVGPHQGRRWQMAKWLHQIADGNHHEMASHLGRTHLVLEAFAIAAERCFAERHPLLPLLRAHLKFLVAINSEARRRLIRPGTFVDNLLGGTLDGSLNIVRRTYESFDFWVHARPAADLLDRGVHDVSTLPHYPYRDDGKLVWAALKAFVWEYLSLHYKNDDDVKNDTELQAFVAELTAPSQGAVSRLTEDNTVQDRMVLAELITAIVWTSGPQHSAVNYSQWDYIGYVPNMPLAAWANPEARTPDAFDLLPPIQSAIEQIDTMWFLSTYRYDRLGQYGDLFKSDLLADKLTRELQLALFHAEDRIERRNARRPVPYPYLRPSHVTQSTSV